MKNRCNTCVRTPKRTPYSVWAALKRLGTLGFFTWLALSLLTPPVSAQQFSAAKSVLVLYWYDKDYPWNVRFDQSFQIALHSASSLTVDHYSEYLETNRFPGENQSLILRDYLRRKYTDRGIDVVVANSDASLDFLLKYREGLFAGAPIVFVASRPRPAEELAAGSSITGVININGHRKTLDLALTLHPATEEVFIISGTLEHDKRFEKLAREELQSHGSRVRITYLTDLPLDQLIVRTKSLPKRSIILYVWQQLQDDQGAVIESVDILTSIAQSAPVPIYGMSTPYLGNGIVGGYINTADAVGTRTAEIVAQILKGARAQDIPAENAPTVPMFDWRELRRWRIPDSLLPPGAIIRFKEITLWDQYRWQITAALLFCLFQAFLIGVLLVERGRRRKSAEALEKINAELHLKMAEINNLSGRLISAQEDERRRISRELHDDVSQQIAALGIRLSAIKRSLNNVDAVRDSVAKVQGDLMRLTTSIHALSHELHPALLERAGLGPALQTHCEEFEAVNGIRVHFTSDLAQSVPSDLELCLYRIAQEALRNILKHSGAKEVSVSLAEVAGHIELAIKDAGRGFDPKAVGARGIGLMSMKERVRMVGGAFDIDSRPEGGTVTRVMVPLPVRHVATI
jgi:signal transduction histidine kinase